MTSRFPPGLLLVPALAAFAIYAPMLPTGFLGDDFGLLHAFDGCDGVERDVALRRSHVRVRRRAAVEPVPAADDGDLRREPHAQPRSVRLASRQRGPADGECGARHAARVAVRRRRHDARACRRGDGRLPVRVVRAGGRGDGVDRRALRRDGAVVAARRGECVRGEPIVARRLRPAESRRDGAVVHEQGVGDDRRAADSRIGVVPVWPRPGAAACAAMAADRGRVLRVPAVSLRRSVPVLPRKLAAPGAAERRVAREFPDDDRLGARRAAGPDAAQGVRGLGRGPRLCAIAAGVTERDKGRALVALVFALAAAFALLLPHWKWAGTAKADACCSRSARSRPLRRRCRSPRPGSRGRSPWIAAFVLLGSQYLLADAVVDRWVDAGDDTRTLARALAQLAQSTPPDRLRVRRDPRSRRGHSVRPQCAGRPDAAAGAGSAARREARRADGPRARAMARSLRAGYHRPPSPRIRDERGRQSADAESAAAVRAPRSLLLLESRRASPEAGHARARRPTSRTGTTNGGVRFRAAGCTG